MPWEKNFNVEDVLDRAMHAFWARGYAATSMQDLVECTGINRASLYATYGDKRALFIACLKRYEQEYCQRQLEHLAALKSSRTAIMNVLQMFIERSAKGDHSGCFMTNTALELAAHDEEVRAAVADTQKAFEDFFRRMVERGKANGEFRKDLSSATAARDLAVTLMGLGVLARSRPDPKLLNAVITDALQRLR